MEEKADIIFENNTTELKMQAEFRKRTMEEQQQENIKTEQKTSMIRRLVRIVTQNPDLVVLTVVVMLALLVGYYVSIIKMGLTTDQIKLQIADFIEFTVIAVSAVIALIGKLYVKQGEISQSLSKSVAKKSDITGRSISE